MRRMSGAGTGRWACSIGVAALTALVVVMPATGASAAPTVAQLPAPWWCAPDARLTVAALPDALPRSACLLDGRPITDEAGAGVEIPPIDRGVSSTVTGPSGTSTVTVWTDAYAVHVRGGQLDAARGYVSRVEEYAVGGTGDRSELALMAVALRHHVVASIGRARPFPVRISVLLSAADTLVSAFAAGAKVNADVLQQANATVGGYLATVTSTVDQAPTLTELQVMADDLRQWASTPGAQTGITAEDMLGNAIMLVNYLIDETARELDGRSLDNVRDQVTRAVGALRAAIERDTFPVITAPDLDQALADLSDHLAGQLPDDGDVGVVPTPSGPSVTDPTEGVLGGASAPPCQDPARAYTYPDASHWQRGSTLKWYYNYNGQSPRYTASDYAAAIGRAFGGITGLADDCGYNWHPNLRHQFMGWSVSTGVGTNGIQCAQRADSYNVVAWLATLPVSDGRQALAVTCTWIGSQGYINGFDIAMNRSANWDIPERDAAIGRTCNMYAPNPDSDVQGVMTHEFGHAVGQGHVPESTHGRLTMSQIMDTYCGRGERSPGYGDSLGLAYMYGKVAN